MDEAVLRDLRAAFEELDADEDVGAVVLAARGPVFSAGFDVDWMAGIDAGTVERELGEVRNIYDTIEKLSQPVVAAVHGPAMGGGLLLALVADVRLASDGASFGAPEVKIGIFPSLDLIPRLERVVGLGRAKRMVLAGDPISAEEAERIGLVDPLVPADRLHDAAGALAQQLASLPRSGVRSAKEAFAASRRSEYAGWEAEAFATCWASPEREAFMRAFLDSD